MSSDQPAVPGAADVRSRRNFLASGTAVAAALATATVAGSAVAATPPAVTDKYADPAKPMLPPSTMQLDRSRTALVVVDPQVDFLSEKGVAWGVDGQPVIDDDLRTLAQQRTSR